MTNHSIKSIDSLLAKEIMDDGIRELRRKKRRGEENTEEFKILTKGVKIYEEYLYGTISEFELNKRLDNLRN